MPTPSADPTPCLFAILAFNTCNQLAVRAQGTRMDQSFFAPTLAEATALLAATFPLHTPPADQFSVASTGGECRVYFSQVQPALGMEVFEFHSIESLEKQTGALSPLLRSILAAIGPFLIDIPYLHLGENDYIYRFRVEKERNSAVYADDPSSADLYQSKLCEVIKALARTNERNATRPAVLDFGPAHYVIPSHFGFCLGVKNAIERAYETLTANPGKRVFMLSELIHNPFVNEDLLRRGLRFLQSDKGRPYSIAGRIAAPGDDEPTLWDTLTADDIVIIPAFGATDEDKQRLIRKGLRVAQHDATCMLVEKVWKAARSFGRDGFTVIIHGKSEHEETKATFSNSRRHAPSLIIRNMADASLIAEFVKKPTESARAALMEHLAHVATPGFDPDLHLQRIAVVNQTTLLMNETAAIIETLRAAFRERFGMSEGDARIGNRRKDTLCYATQVNQDALSTALAEPLDAAFVIGGKNSSNTYQLFRLCEKTLGEKAYFIQSESCIHSRASVDHYIFPAHGGKEAGITVTRPLWAEDDIAPKRILITGGASCPDGLIQQVITRINALFPHGTLRSIDAVLADLNG